MKNNILIIVLALLFNACSFSPIQGVSHVERSVANSKLDQIIDEFKAHYESEISVERKSEMSIVQENLLKYLIEATHGDEAHKLKTYKSATTYFNKVYPLILGNIREEKNGGSAFKEITRAPLWTLKDELEYLNQEVAKLPEPPVKIELVEGMKLLSPFYKNLSDESRSQLSNQYGKSVTKVFGQEFNLHSSFEEIETLITNEGSEKEKILSTINLVENKLKNHEKKIRSIGSEIAKSGKVDMGNVQIRLVVRFMDYYFNKIPDDVIKTIMSELVTGGPRLPEEEIMKIIFKNTGPGLGKVLQQIGKEKGVGGEFSKLMSVLESSGKEVPYHLVERVVKGDKGGFEIRSLDKKPLGTGTIAQVNKAKLWDNNVEKEIALRFLKPGVEKRCKEDIQILRQFVPDNEALFKAEGVEDIKIVSTLIDSVEKFLNEEVDLSIAVERQKTAYEIYNRSVKVSSNPKFDMLEMRVPEVYVAPNGKSNLHVQEFASGGVKFNDLSDAATKKVVAQEMIRMWFEEALFRSGFLNADLHQGNFRVVLVEENNKIKVLLYDFGLSSTLTKEDQRAFMLVGAGAYLKSPKTIAEGLLVSMQSNDSAMREKLIKDIAAEMKVRNMQPEGWIAWCVQKNYFVSDKLGALARGSLLLKQLPESVGDTEMFKETIIKTALANLKRSVADRDYEFPLKKIDLVKIGLIQVKNSCVDMFRSFFGK
jgi:ubiquinone biosynthesis protein